MIFLTEPLSVSVTDTNPALSPSWVGAAVTFIILAGFWALAAETIRRAFGRRALWTVTTIVALAAGVYILVAVRPRVAPQPDHPLAFAAVLLVVAGWFVVPTYVVDRGARRSPVRLIRQLSLGALAGAGTVLAGFLITYIGALLLG